MLNRQEESKLPVLSRVEHLGRSLLGLVPTNVKQNAAIPTTKMLKSTMKTEK